MFVLNKLYLFFANFSIFSGNTHPNFNIKEKIDKNSASLGRKDEKIDCWCKEKIT